MVWQALVFLVVMGVIACQPDPIDISGMKTIEPSEQNGSGDTMTGKLIGDFNNDGVVNVADFDIYKKKFNYTIYPPGDYNQDGVVDQSDLLVYNSGSLAADGNADGKVDQADFVVFSDNLNRGLTSYNAADMDRDGDVDMDDFKLWREREKELLESKE